MQKFNHSQHSFIINLNQSDRWQAYYRLLELGIPCICSTGMPLRVSVVSPSAALQVWSVTRTEIATRHNLAKWLNQCLLAQLSSTNISY